MYQLLQHINKLDNNVVGIKYLYNNIARSKWFI